MLSISIKNDETYWKALGISEFKKRTCRNCYRQVHLYNGTPDRTRTCDLRIRSPLLYPAELQAHFVKNFE